MFNCGHRTAAAYSINSFFVWTNESICMSVGWMACLRLLCVLHNQLWLLLICRVVQKKIARSLMHHYFETVCCRITWFSTKSLEKINVYRSVLNLYQLVKYSLIYRLNLIHVMSDITLHAKMTPLTDEYWWDWKGWIVKKFDYWVSSETVEIAYAVWSLTNNWVYWLRWKAAW